MRWLLAILVTLCLGLLPRYPVAAATYDGSVPFLCGLMTILECDDTGECQRRAAASVNLPQFVKVDAQQQKLLAADESGDSTPIERVERLDGRLLIQGGEGGRGWSAVVNEETGKLSATVVDETVAFIIFGACTML